MLADLWDAGIIDIDGNLIAHQIKRTTCNSRIKITPFCNQAWEYIILHVNFRKFAE